MNHLKLFNDFINEAIINPIDTTEIINVLKSLDKIESLADINNKLQEFNVYFSYYDEFFNSLGTEKEKEVAPPRSVDINKGIKFALYNKYLQGGVINIVVPDKFVEIFNKKVLNEEYYSLLSEILKHESIHSKQVSKMGKDRYSLEDSPTNPKKYFSNQQEIMAYANSFVTDLTARGKSKEDIEKLLRSEKDINQWIWGAYKRLVDEKEFKKFVKYVYLYLQEV